MLFACGNPRLQGHALLGRCPPGQQATTGITCRFRRLLTSGKKWQQSLWMVLAFRVFAQHLPISASQRAMAACAKLIDFIILFVASPGKGPRLIQTRAGICESETTRQSTA